MGADFRQDWPTALRQAGFDPNVPTAWIAEGLIGYISADTQDRLLDHITTLSAPGSRLGTDDLPVGAGPLNEQMRQMGESWKRHGFDAGFDNLFGDNLLSSSKRNDLQRYLEDRGWNTIAATLADLFASAGIGFPQVEFGDGVNTVVHVTATRDSNARPVVGRTDASTAPVVDLP